jgi:hypothetical protein
MAESGGEVLTRAPGGQTNLWAGLAAALDALSAGGAAAAAGRRLRAILLLTDGAPNFR